MSATTTTAAPITVASTAATTLQIKPFEWILDNRYRWLFHILFWMVIYFDDVSSLLGLTPAYNYPLAAFGLFVTDVVMVYLNLYVFIPIFLLKNKLIPYLVFSLLSVIMNAFFIEALYYSPEDYEPDYLAANIISNTILALTVLGTAVCIKLFKFLLHEKQRRQEAEKMSLETEIAYLKDQINPHFLFNSLNNLYVQIRKRPAEAAESVLLLSDLLRYQLYDSAKEQVYLSGEIDYLKNYLELDKMRRSQLNVEFTVEGTPNGKMVAPYLFLPFIENAIKHGAGTEEVEYIKVNFRIETEQIVFSVTNSKPETAPNHPAGGIGLANVQRRLELLYPKRHELMMVNREKEYEMRLELQME